MKPLHLLTIREAATLIASRDLSPVTLTEHFLSRIERLDHAYVSYLYVDHKGALRAAQMAEDEIASGEYKGLLHGIPFAVKDNYETAGLPMTAGSRILSTHISNTDADSVAKLKSKGAILLGKLNTWEYGTGNAGISFDLPTPPARNPWNLNHFTGGSSSGSGAALAAGLATFTLGSDTGGSVRLPAAACGVFGLKPTLGRVSRRGVQPNCYSFDTVGPLARSAEDCAILLDALSGFDPADAMSANTTTSTCTELIDQPLQGVRIGLLGQDDLRLDLAIRNALMQASQALVRRGATVELASMPVRPDLYRRITTIINWSESYAIHQSDLEENEHLMGHALREKLIKGRRIPASSYIDAQRQRRLLTQATDALFNDFDLLLLPTTATPAPNIDDRDAVKAFTVDAATHAFSLTGHPGISIPAGLSEGLPISVQLGGRYFEESLLLAASHALNQYFGTHSLPEPADSLPDLRHVVAESTIRRSVKELEEEALTAVQILGHPALKTSEPASMYVWHGR